MNASIRSFLQYAHRVTGARAASFYRFDGETQELRLAASCHHPLNGSPRRFRLGEGILGTAAQTGKAHFCRQPASCPNFVLEDPQAIPTGSILCMPLNGDGRNHGVLTLRWDAPQPEPDMTLLRHVWGTAGDLLGIFHEDRGYRRLTSLEQLAGARRVQHGLTPPAGTLSTGTVVASLYRPFHEVGGDLLAVHAGVDHTLLAIGDVAGHDTGAAMVMAMVHGLLGHLASRERSPARILAGLDESLRSELGPPWFITMLLCQVDHRAGELVVAGAGHPPGYLLAPGGEEILSIGSQDPPVGLAREPFEERRHPVPAGGLLVLHTDGLEGPFESSRVARARLLELLLASHGSTPEDLCARLAELLDSAGRGAGDDVAVLVARLP